MVFGEMAADILLWRFPALPEDVVFDIIEANAREREFVPDARGLKRIWKEMRRSEKAALFEDYDRADDGFGPERQAVLSATVAEAVKFDNDLYFKPDEEIHELYAQMAREQSVVFDKVRSEFDRDAFFNEPEATADFSVWMQMPMWTVNEAAALSLGKNPDILTPKSMKAIRRSKSNFAQVYAFRRTAIKRAVSGGHFKDPMPRADFIRWAAEHQIALPEPLAAVAAGLPESLPSPQERIAGRIRSAHQAAATKREDKSFHKMIAGMAVRYYKCGNDAMFSQAVKAITSDVHQIGHDIDDDTVRKHLKDALALPTNKKVI
ncbi:hypothetical protein [Ancylobacter vacuolatus]|uniref:Uncharacterized protein n=1 Tax=Ancylobacter vacuolatus TaxID=223389 RepID=A0ABU0DLX0_9HYPH|nr:hypothetical protein [Ancylobacter vacuolatus]MDQ0349409.1 hypothetical protein [Ancylobacter vacuolatus]